MQKFRPTVKIPTYGKNVGLRSGNIINSIKAEVFKPLLFLHRQKMGAAIVICGNKGGFYKVLLCRT